MARQTNPQPPEQGVPAEQALITPAVRPEVLLALQQQQASQAINNECALIRQEIGRLRGELQGVKDVQTGTSGEIASLKKFHHIVIGIVIAAAALISVVWYFAGSKFSTLLKMAEETQFCEAHPAEKICLN
jgi:hypothetical protein